MFYLKNSQFARVRIKQRFEGGKKQNKFSRKRFERFGKNIKID
jgi:hypothetical protein